MKLMKFFVQLFGWASARARGARQSDARVREGSGLRARALGLTWRDVRRDA